MNRNGFLCCLCETSGLNSLKRTKWPSNPHPSASARLFLPSELSKPEEPVEFGAKTQAGDPSHRAAQSRQLLWSWLLRCAKALRLVDTCSVLNQCTRVATNTRNVSSH